MEYLQIITQFIIPGGGFILILLAMVLFRKRCGTITFPGGGSLTLGEKAKSDPRVSLCQARLDDQLVTIRQIFFSAYLRQLKENGCPEEILAENDDAAFVDQCLGNIVFSGNGIKSIKSIIEKSLIDESFITMDFSDYVRYLVSASQLNAQKYMNDHYRTIVRLPDGSERARIVSGTEWFDSVPRVMELARPVLEDVVKYSRELYGVKA
jgi:hypothetical protein